MTVRNEQGETYVSQFPFVVGQQFSKNIGIYAMMLAALIAAVYGLWRYSQKPTPAAIPE